MLLHNILISFFFFLLFILRHSLCLCYLNFSTLTFSCSFLFSKIFLSFFSIFSLLCEGLFFCYVGVGMVGHRFWVMPWVWVCVMVFVGLAMVGHQFHGFVGHVVGFVWWVISVVVMPWVWWVINFRSCRGCGLLWVLFL